MAFACIKSISTTALVQVLTSLTHRELQVVRMIGEGRTSKEIASELVLSTGTIGNYRKALCRKLCLHSTAELAAFGSMVEHRTADARGIGATVQ